MFNPILIYVYSFLAAFILYLFGFSTIYPNISFETIIFFVLSFLIAGCLGFRISKKWSISNFQVKYHKSLIYITTGLIFAHILEFIYTGQFPIAGIGSYIEYAGIPTLHVIIYTFNIFFAVYLFNVIIFARNKKVPIILFIVTLTPAFLILSRGMMVNIAIGCVFVLIYTLGNSIDFYKKHLWKVVLLGFLGLYLFGVSGNIRNNTLNQNPNKFESSYIMDVGGASDFFRKSIIPKEFFWGYLYISSPLANFERVVQTHTPNITMESIKNYFANEVVMDFLSKRIFKDGTIDQKNMELIAPTLTVGTGFRGAYYYLGWIGVSLSFSFLMGISYLYMKFLSLNNPFRIVGIAMLANLVALFTFDNMIIYSGMSFQLIYPILWEVYIRYKTPIKSMLIKSKDIIQIFIKGEMK